MVRAFSIVMLVFGLIVDVPCSQASQLITVEKALQQIFPNNTDIRKEALCLSPLQVAHIEQKADLIFNGVHATEMTRFTIYEKGRIAGYAFEDIVEGKWGPIHYVVGLTPEGKVVGLTVLDYEEIRGKPIAKKRFLKQYFGKSIQDPLRLRKDIDGITGATISSRAFTDGVRKILHVFHELEAGAVHNCEKS